MGGVWERQICTVRNVLSSLTHDFGASLDDESLRTFFCETMTIVNCRPLTVDGLNDPLTVEPPTRNLLLTMKSKIILPPPGNFQKPDLYCWKRWRRVQYLANEFWTRWKKEFLQTLQERRKWGGQQRNVSIGDVVLIKKDNSPRNTWQLVLVIETIPSNDGLVRKVKVCGSLARQKEVSTWILLIHSIQIINNISLLWCFLFWKIYEYICFVSIFMLRNVCFLYAEHVRK